MTLLEKCKALLEEWEATDRAGGGCPGCQDRTRKLRIIIALEEARISLDRRLEKNINGQPIDYLDGSPTLAEVNFRRGFECDPTTPIERRPMHGFGAAYKDGLD